MLLVRCRMIFLILDWVFLDICNELVGVVCCWVECCSVFINWVGLLLCDLFWVEGKVWCDKGVLLCVNNWFCVNNGFNVFVFKFNFCFVDWLYVFGWVVCCVDRVL